MTICWADRVAVIWGLAMLMLGLCDGAASEHGADFFHDLVKVVVVPWIFLRGVDLILGGHARRRREAPRYRGIHGAPGG